MNILFVAKKNSENFIRNFAPYLPEGSELLVNDRAPGIGWDVAEINRAAQGKDWVIFEWANHATRHFIDHCKFDARICVRIHDHELKIRPQTGTRRVDEINWERVHKAWFINREVMGDFDKSYPEVDHFFLPNAVDPQPFTENLVDNKKIGLLSIYTRPRKRIDRAIELMKLLPDWELTIRTDHRGAAADDIQTEFERLLELSLPLGNVKWELREDVFAYQGYPRDDVNHFFQDKAVVINTSDREGFNYSIAEGMLCGNFSAVWNWDYGYPRDFWSPYVHDNLESMAAAIRAYKPSHEYRQYIIDNFHPEKLLVGLREKLNTVKVKA